MADLPRLRWFGSREEYDAAVLPGQAIRRAHERLLAQEPERAGWCLACSHETTFTVPSGGFFAEQPDLREGWRCARCSTTNRHRVLLHAVRETLEG